jgi:putative ATPase
MELIATLSDGDARRALMALEIAVLSVAATTRNVDRTVAQESLQKRVIRFDPNGDDHYDVASAFIKSIRGSDPDASLYWLARMLESGEDPRFIARRLVISASEDIGNADPQALLIAAYKAIDAALHDVRNNSVLPVPMHLRDGHYKGAEKLGHGVGCQYAHDSDDGWVEQDYLGVPKQYYEPVSRGHEVQFRAWVDKLRQQQRASTSDDAP